MKNRVLIIFSSDYVGGAEKNLVKLSSSNNLNEKCEYYLYTFRNPGKLLHLFSSTTNNYFNFYSRIKIINILYVIFLTYKFKIKFLYISGFRYSVYLRILNIFFPKTKIVVAQRWNPNSSRLIDKMLRVIERFFCYFTHGYISNSKAANYTLSKIIKNKEKLHTIYNGIEIKFNQYDKNYDFDICVLAHISNRKGHMDFLDKIFEIKKLIPGIKVVFIGTNLLKSKILFKVKKLMLEENIIFSDYQTKVDSFLNRSKILVLPSKVGEGLPTAIIEGLNNKLPVIAYDIDGNREVIIDDFNGYLVDKAKNNIIEKIIKILLDQNKFNFLSENSHEILIKKFTNDNFYSKHNQYFNNG